MRPIPCDQDVLWSLRQLHQRCPASRLPEIPMAQTPRLHRFPVPPYDRWPVLNRLTIWSNDLVMGHPHPADARHAMRSIHRPSGATEHLRSPPGYQKPEGSLYGLLGAPRHRLIQLLAHLGVYPSGRVGVSHFPPPTPHPGPPLPIPLLAIRLLLSRESESPQETPRIRALPIPPVVRPQLA